MDAAKGMERGVMDHEREHVTKANNISSWVAYDIISSGEWVATSSTIQSLKEDTSIFQPKIKV